MKAYNTMRIYINQHGIPDTVLTTDVHVHRIVSSVVRRDMVVIVAGKDGRWR